MNDERMSIQTGSAGGMPVLILKEGASETKGKEAQKNNINAQIMSSLKLSLWSFDMFFSGAFHVGLCEAHCQLYSLPYNLFQYAWKIQ